MGLNLKVGRASRSEHKINGDIFFKDDIPSDTILDVTLKKQSSPGNWVDTMMKYQKNLCDFVANDREFWPKIVQAGTSPAKCPFNKGDYKVNDAILKYNVPPMMEPACYKGVLHYRDGKTKKLRCTIILRFWVSKKDGSPPGKCSK